MKELDSMRAAGWSVAVHNDYRLGGATMMFWLFTHPLGIWAKGEGSTDREAVYAARESAQRAAYLFDMPEANPGLLPG